MFDFSYATDVAAAATLGVSCFGFITGGAYMYIQGQRANRRARRLEYMIERQALKEAEEFDGYAFNAEPSVMCMGCGQSVPTLVDGFTVAPHDCPYAQPELELEAPKKIPIGYTGHLHLAK